MNEIIDNSGKILVAVIGLLFFVLAARLVAGAKKAQYNETARMGFNAVIAMVFVAIGAGAIGFAAFGGKILTALGIS